MRGSKTNSVQGMMQKTRVAAELYSSRVPRVCALYARYALDSVPEMMRGGTKVGPCW